MDADLKSKPKRDAAATKERILAAATKCFSELGYAKTGIREVAAAAGVSYTLVGRYFGSKAGLLEAALIDTLRIELILDVDRAAFGRHLATSTLAALEGQKASSMTVLAAADLTARDIATRAMKHLIVKPLAAWIGPPDAHERAVAIIMLGSGFMTHAQLLPLLGSPEALGPEHPAVEWFANAVQRIVDEPIGWQGAALRPTP